MFDTIKAKLKTIFGPVASIINARLTMLFGLATAGVGLMDWSPLISTIGTSTAFNKTQVFALGAIAFVKGLVDEVARRANDTTLKDKK